MIGQTVDATKGNYVFQPFPNEIGELLTNADVEGLAFNPQFRYELIGGELIVSTAPRFIHQLLSARLMAEFSSYLQKNPHGLILATVGLILSEFDGVIPDLIYVSHERCAEILNKDDGKLHGAPELVIEILSPGRVNAHRDLQIKRELYEIYGVGEYWVVKPLEMEVEVFRTSGGKLSHFQTFHNSETLQTDVLKGLKINLAQIFAD